MKNITQEQERSIYFILSGVYLNGRLQQELGKNANEEVIEMALKEIKRILK